MKRADERHHRCWECDEEFAVTVAEDGLGLAPGPVLYCPLCGSVRVEPVSGEPSIWTLWARALHAAPVH